MKGIDMNIYMITIEHNDTGQQNTIPVQAMHINEAVRYVEDIFPFSSVVDAHAKASNVLVVDFDLTRKRVA